MPVLLCLRVPSAHAAASADVWTRVPSLEAGAAALCEHCEDPGCAGDHVLAYADSHGETHVIGSPRPPPLPLSEELARLYPRAALTDVEKWPAPGELNPPLDRPANASPLPDKQEHAHLLRNTPAIPPLLGPTSPLPDETARAGVVAPLPRCGVAGCELRQYRNGLCENHFWATYPPLPISLPTSVEARFWSHVHKTTDCWLWTGCKTKNGYGSFKADGRAVYAHHFSHQLTAGPIPKGLRLARRPTCPANCCRSDHWRPVTYSAAHTNGDPVMTLVKPPR